MKKLILLIVALFLHNALGADAIFFNEKKPDDKKEDGGNDKKPDDDDSPKAGDSNDDDPLKDPLFAGTLLQVYAKNADPGRLSVQPYFFMTRRYGLYDKESHVLPIATVHQYATLLSLQTGLTKVIDFTLVFSGAYTHSPHGSVFHPDDTVVSLGFQLVEGNNKTAKPDIRFLIGESIPTGVYHRLNPLISEVDFTGDGTFDTIFILVWRKNFFIIPCHPFDINVNLIYVFSQSARVEGLSAFGGGPDTFGRVYPGDQYIGNLAIDFMLDKHWEIGLDIRYEHQNRTHFVPVDPLTTPILVPSTERLSLAPCLGYSPDEDFSFTIGYWFSVRGSNSFAFASAAATIFYYF